MVEEGRLPYTHTPPSIEPTMQILLVILATFGLLLASANSAFAQDNGTAAAQEQDTSESHHGVRLQTHFHKPLLDSGWGVGGWVALPDIIGQSTSTLFLIGPNYAGEGWWVEGLMGGIMPAGDPITHPWVLSGRFEFTPVAINAPVRIWGNIQLIDLMGDAIVPYTMFMVDYVVADGKVLLGLETENSFNRPAAEDSNANASITDASIGPQIVFPFKGLNVTAAYQIHFHESVANQYWLRVTYTFSGGPE